jgi:predicted metal-binding membrane protein
VAGYLCVWIGVGVAAYGLFELVRALDPAFLEWDEAGRYVTGGVIVAAAVYQLTPLKQACLVKCRSPIRAAVGQGSSFSPAMKAAIMMFLAERWRHGRAGGLELGDVPGFAEPGGGMHDDGSPNGAGMQMMR